MRILKPHYKKMKIYGLKGGTCLNILVIIIFLIPTVVFFRHEKINLDKLESYQHKAYAQEQTIRKLTSPQIYTDIELKQVEQYIRKVFGKDGNVAVAVAKGECRGLSPKCRFVTKQEHSVCQFQINITAHPEIPGKDLDEKEAWLMNSQNCTLMAYHIFQTSGWYPWTSYTSGNYEQYL
jgi:hypothetical protein